MHVFLLLQSLGSSSGNQLIHQDTVVVPSATPVIERKHGETIQSFREWAHEHNKTYKPPKKRISRFNATQRSLNVRPKTDSNSATTEINRAVAKGRAAVEAHRGKLQRARDERKALYDFSRQWEAMVASLPMPEKLEDAIKTVRPICFDNISEAQDYDMLAKGKDLFENAHKMVGLRDDYHWRYEGFDKTGQAVKLDPLHLFKVPQWDNEENPGAIAIFKNAWVTTQAAIVFDCNVAWHQGGCDSEHHREKLLRASDHEVFSKTPRVVLTGQVVLISQFYGAAYYHVMIEDLVRVALLHDYLIQHPDVRVICAPSEGITYLFGLLGISADRIIPWDADAVFAVETLLVPTPTPCGQMQGPAGNYMSNFFRRAFAQRELEGEDIGVNMTHGLILVQRRLGKRRLSNHRQLMIALRNLFPHRVVAEFTGVKEMKYTIALHMRAALIIGPHGAGLSNLLFAQPGTGVIEIHPLPGNGHRKPAMLNFCHTVTCERLGMRCKGLLGYGHQARFFAPIPRVVELAKDLLGEETAQFVVPKERNNVFE